MCTDGKKTPTEYVFGTTFRDQKDIQNDHSYANTSVKVNGEEVVAVIVEDGKQVADKTIHKVKVPLHGCDEYELEREDCIKCKLDDDDLLTFTATKLTNTLTVTISHTPNLEILFIKMGTLNNFQQKQNSPILKKFEYKGIIYKEQGYIIKINKK